LAQNARDTIFEGRCAGCGIKTYFTRLKFL
jgi:hypothetical protein